MNSLAGRGTDALTECHGVHSSSQSSTPPTHSTLTQSLPSSSEILLRLLGTQSVRVLNVLSPHLFSPCTELSVHLTAFLSTSNTDNTPLVLHVLPSRGCLHLSTHLSSPYRYLSLDFHFHFDARCACHPRIVDAVKGWRWGSNKIDFSNVKLSVLKTQCCTILTNQTTYWGYTDSDVTPQKLIHTFHLFTSGVFSVLQHKCDFKVAEQLGFCLSCRSLAG